MLCLFISFIIEFYQFFIGRHSDIDDIILNMRGALLGYLLSIIIKNLKFKL